MLETHYLASFFEPRSVAVIGASERENSVGNIVFGNILASGFQGPLYPVNPKHESILGIAAYKSIEKIPDRVDLAVITTRPQSVPEIIEECGKKGIRNAIVISSGFSEAGRSGANLERKTLKIANRYGIRILGPSCLGIIRPAIGLNATFTRATARAGHLALVSQSGSICSAILDWASMQEVGFSSVITLGRNADIDIGEVLDYLAHDKRTHYILIYIESIRNARRFMSALRPAARIKPVILLKAGRHTSGSNAIRIHSGQDTGSDAVFDAAVRRAGVVRVKNVGQLFYASKALTAKFCPLGNRLAIITNGGGPGAMAADRASDMGVPLAELSAKTLKALNGVLPPAWSRSNPVDILGDATPERYREAINAVSGDDGVDGILIMLSPQALTQAREVAHAVIAISEHTSKPIITCWMGEGRVGKARSSLEKAGIPSFRMPETAVDLYSYISSYYRNQKLLLQTTEPIAPVSPQEEEGAIMLIKGALRDGRKILSEMESKALLHDFRIPVAQTRVAHTVNEALSFATLIGYPVAMKIDSPDIEHKNEAGGVRLNITTATAVRSAFHDIPKAVRKRFPEARLSGVSIEPCLQRANSRELTISVVRDPVFGPIIALGSGGSGKEVPGDHAVALPPLNRFLTKDLIRSIPASRLLGEYHHMPPIHKEALEDVLLHISEMVCELPWVQTLNLSPLIVDEFGAIAADARITIDEAQIAGKGDRYSHMAIHPYPADLIQEWELPDGLTVTLRPIRPEDAEIEQQFIRQLSDESRHNRFMDTLRELTQAMLVRFTQIDYDRDMALAATLPNENGKEVLIGVARYAANPDGKTVEFALVVADEWQHRGIGRKLMKALIDCARRKGYRDMEGDVLAMNSKMLRLVSSLGFTIQPHHENAAAKRVSYSLQPGRNSKS